MSILAQTTTVPFPGKLVSEGKWAGINPNDELIYLGNNHILGWAAGSKQYRIWRYDPAFAGGIDTFPEQLLTEGVLSTAGSGHRLTYLGNSRILEWEPGTGQYKVQQYHLDTTKSTDLLSTQSIVEGTLGKSSFERKLIYLGDGRILDWQPETGRYQFWRYDPTITGKDDTFPGELIAAGTWPTIRTGHELVYLNYRRILDWEPQTGRYRIWRYDPMVTGNDNPLVGNPVAEGTFGTIRTGHQLMSLGDNHLLEWQPQSGQYHIWQFELMAVGAFSIADIGQKLAAQTITGVTVVTHGRQSSDSDGDSLLALAQDIHNKAGGWLLDYDVDGNGNEFFDTCTNDCETPAPGEGGTNEVVLLFDWAAASNELSSGWGEAAGDALFHILVEITLVDPAAVDNPPYHLIGHSFGTAVISEVIERLAYFGIPVDQATFLDPHDFDEGFGFDGAQRMFDLGQPPGYGVSVWNNVTFADVYYQTRGGGRIIAFPKGRPIPGAYNKFLLSELPGNPSSYPIADSDHTYVWNCFYRATVIGALPNACLPPAVNPNYAQTGYAFSRIKHTASRPGPNFYAPEQNHSYSELKIVATATGQPNLVGLAELGLSAEQIIQGRWEPDWQPFAITNGDFEQRNTQEWDGLFGIPIPIFCINLTGENTCSQPGWSYHGGGGTGHFEQTGNHNAYLELDWDNTSHAHNWLNIPSNATELQFDLRREDGPSGSADKFEVKLSNQTVISYTLTENNEDGDFVTQHIPLPPSLLSQTTPLTFTFSTPIDLLDGSTVWIDKVKFVGPPQEIQVLAGTTDIPDNSGPIDFGQTTVGVPLNRIYTIKNTGSLDLALIEPITVPAGFSLVHTFGDTTLSAGQTTTFTVQLTATTIAIFSGTLAFANNDSNENPFNFALSGAVVKPKAMYLPVVLK